ncbi:MAG TPA: M20/M25/M40 family metallo-hydrolase [Vicinamibacterales bacterium]|nr:M20/M25/M40 family metallo-hydrolase [Vicinamibacterales bacterium]HPW20345.1 M20/M25/M40 family metallo-hydrolase [Vicinamibacterales bacterium]
MTRRTLLAGLAAVVATAALLASPAVRAGSEPINYADINKIKAEGLQNSQVMELASWLTDVYAPRLTGSPTFLKAAEWTVAKMKEWGLANAKIEPWTNRNGFERGWTNDKFYLSAVAPERFPIPGTPAAWTPGTNGLVSGEVVLVTATTEAELAPYKGTLRGKWVLTQAAPDVAAYWKPLATRYTAEELAELESWPAPQPEFGVAAPGAGRMGGPGPGPGAPAAQAPQAGGRQGQPGQPAAAAQPGIVPPAAVQAMMRGTAAAAARHAFFKAEGVLGMFTTTPRGHGIYTISGNRASDPAATVPAISIAAEHYGRLARMVAKNVPVVLEADIRNTFTPDPPVFNVVGEIPGTDKADEIVLLGGHFDTWHASPGATDNAAGVAAMLEALRILKTTGVGLRRTVRVGLWGGEEQGLLGSREYVSTHFASRQPLPATPGAPPAPAGGRGGFGGPQGPLELKPAYDKLSVYFNIDNGAGAIRGIYLQGNDAVGPIFREWMEPFRSLGMTTVTIRNTGGTDHQAFDAVGLPGFQFIQDELEYETLTHHTNMDTYERLQPNDMRKMATIAAGFAYLAANRDEKLPRKPLTVPVAGRGGR